MKLFVASLPFAATNQDLINLFSEEGGVIEAKVILDKETRKSKGYAFVTMDGEDAAKSPFLYLTAPSSSGWTNGSPSWGCRTSRWSQRKSLGEQGTVHINI